MNLNRSPVLLCTLLIASGAAFADAGHSHQPSLGAAADPAEATRAIEVIMTDNRYDHDAIEVRAGEVVRFVVHNHGQLVHEFNIGTPMMHESHQAEMLEMMASPNSEHLRSVAPSIRRWKS